MRLHSSSRRRTAKTVASVLFVSAVGCAEDGCTGCNRRTQELDNQSWAVDPTRLDMDLFETAELTFSGDASEFQTYEIQIGPAPGLNFFNPSAGIYVPADRAIREFLANSGSIFSVTIQVECLAAFSGDVTFTYKDGSTDVLSVPITCATGGNPTGTSTSPTSTSGDGNGSTSEGEGEGEVGSTGGPSTAYDLLCRYLYGETLQAITVDGADAGVEDFEPGVYFGAWDLDPDGAVIASLTSEAGPVGFGLWASPDDLLVGEPTTFIDDENASASSRACATEAGGVFAGFGADAMFCDFMDGSCTSLGLDNPMFECVCDGMECLGYDSTRPGYLYSSDGGRSFSSVMDNVQPGSLRSNSAGAVMFRDGVTGDVMHGASLGGPFSPSSIPAGAELVGPNLLGDGVAFMSDLGGGTALTLRSEDDGESFVEVAPPGEFAFGQMTQLADGRVFAPDTQFNLWLSTDATATDFDARDDIEINVPFDCLAVGEP